jgi:hypothetical protein
MNLDWKPKVSGSWWKFLIVLACFPWVGLGPGARVGGPQLHLRLRFLTIPRVAS